MIYKYRLCVTSFLAHRIFPRFVLDSYISVLYAQYEVVYWGGGVQFFMQYQYLCDF